MMRVVAVAAIDRELDLAGIERRRVDGVVAAEPVDDERVVAALGAAIFTCAGSPLTDRPTPPLLTTLMWSSPAVPLTVTVSGWPSPPALPASPPGRSPTCFTSVPVRSLTMMLSAPPRALNWMCLDAVEVHGDVADVAEQPHPSAIGRDVDVLVGVGAVEHERIGAGLTLDRVAAVARVPDEHVVAVAEQGHVVAATAGDDVVAVAADQRVGALAADDGVVAGAAVDGELDLAGTERAKR